MKNILTDSPCKILVNSIEVQLKSSKGTMLSYKKQSLKENCDRIQEGLKRLRQTSGDTDFNLSWSLKKFNLLLNGKPLSLFFDGDVYDILSTYNLKDRLTTFSHNWESVWNSIETELKVSLPPHGAVNQEVIDRLNLAFYKIKIACEENNYTGESSLTFANFMKDQQGNLVYL